MNYWKNTLGLKIVLPIIKNNNLNIYKILSESWQLLIFESSNVIKWF
jgi:hypothetical protein